MLFIYVITNLLLIGFFALLGAALWFKDRRRGTLIGSGCGVVLSIGLAFFVIASITNGFKGTPYGTKRANSNKFIITSRYDQEWLRLIFELASSRNYANAHCKKYGKNAEFVKEEYDDSDRTWLGSLVTHYYVCAGSLKNDQ